MSLDPFPRVGRGVVGFVFNPPELVDGPHVPTKTWCVALLNSLDVFPEPRRGGAAVGAMHLDPLDLAQLDKAISADQEREEYGEGGDASKTPVGLFNEVLQVHTVQTSQEGAHGQAKGANAEFEVQKHEGVTVGVKNGANTVINPLVSSCAVRRG